MKIELQWLNCFWLILPLLAWNIILGPRIVDPRITSDDHSPKWLLLVENFARIFVFAIPVLLQLQLRSLSSNAGMWIYILGTLVYFASWLPFLFVKGSAWSNSVIGLLAPRLTPFLSFLGIALIGQSWLYLLIAATFITLHTGMGCKT